MARHSLSFAGFALALAVFVCGCKQGPGDRCEVNRDCEDGYFCNDISTDTAGGICAPIDTAPTVDSGAPVDTGAPVDSSPADVSATEPTDTEADQTTTDTAEGTTPDAASETPPIDATAESAAD